MEINQNEGCLKIQRLILRVEKALTFLEDTVLLAEGMGFWVAMDWMRKGEKDEEFSVIVLGLSGEEHRE